MIDWVGGNIIIHVPVSSAFKHPFACCLIGVLFFNLRHALRIVIHETHHPLNDCE